MLTFQFLLGAKNSDPATWVESKLYPAESFHDCLKQWKGWDPEKDTGLWHIWAFVRIVRVYSICNKSRLPIPRLVTVLSQPYPMVWEAQEISDLDPSDLDTLTTLGIDELKELAQ
jgi:hypothetical protein